MAKFRQGDLVLQTNQKIIQGGVNVLDDNGDATLASIKLTSSVRITDFDIDGTLFENSDSLVATQKAVKTYVDSAIGGAIPTGTDESVMRYNGTNAIQDSQLFINDFGVMSGVESISFENTDSILLIDSTSGEPLMSTMWDGVNLHATGSSTPSLAVKAGEVEMYDANNLAVTKISTSGATTTIANLGNGSGRITLEAYLFGGEGTTVETILTGATWGSCDLYYNSYHKLATSSTGIRLYGDEDDGDDITLTRYVIPGHTDWDCGAINHEFVIRQSNGNLAFKATEDSYTRIYGHNQEVATLGANNQIIGGTRGSERITLDIDNVFYVTSLGSDNTYYEISTSGGETHRMIDNGILIFQGNNSVQTLGISGDTNIELNQSQNDIRFRSGGSTMLFIDNDTVELYHSGSKVAETTANGITGAVWG